MKTVKIYAQQNIFDNFDIIDSLNQYLFLNVSKQDCIKIMNFIHENNMNEIEYNYYKDTKLKLLKKFKGLINECHQ